MVDAETLRRARQRVVPGEYHVDAATMERLRAEIPEGEYHNPEEEATRDGSDIDKLGWIEIHDLISQFSSEILTDRSSYTTEIIEAISNHIGSLPPPECQICDSRTERRRRLASLVKTSFRDITLLGAGLFLARFMNLGDILPWFSSLIHLR